MRSIKAKLKKPAANSNGSKDEWSKIDQRIWHSVAVNQPAKLASKLSKYNGINVNKLCPSVGYSVVHYAAAKGLDDCLNVLLAHKADVSSRDVTASTPLHASARYGHKGTTTKLLASRTVDVNAYDQNHCTALHFAAFEGHVECVKLISNEKDCDVHCVDKDGRTALMVAAAMGRLSVCQELIRRGVDVNHKDVSSLQHTALSLAAEAGHVEVVKLLCESGADYNAKLTDGKNALEVARNRARRSVVDALHIIQLTEAAKKTDRGARLSTSSKVQVETPQTTGQSAPLQEIPLPLPYMDDSNVTGVSQSPVAKKEEEKPRSPASKRANATVVSLYNDSKHSNLYDRDVSIYDSKSTLASISSLDVFTNPEASKASQPEHPPTPKARSGEGTRNALKLAEELLQKEEQISLLESQIRQMKNSYNREIDSLKNSNAKYEISVQELEKANISLSQDFRALQVSKKGVLEEVAALQVSKKAALEEIAALQTADNNRLVEAEKNSKQLQEKVAETEGKLKTATSKLKDMSAKNLEAMNFYKNEQRKNKEVTMGLNQLLLDIGKPSDNGDYEECLRLLKFELLQASEKSAKKIENDEEKKIEIEQLQNKISEQNELIDVLTKKLSHSETVFDKYKVENQKLVLTVRDIKERLQQAESVNSKQINTISLQNRDIAHLKEQLSAKADTRNSEIKDLEDKLQVALSISDQVMKEYNTDKSLWKQAEDILEREAKEAKEKCDEASQKSVENEKAISELRVARNQREAKIIKLEKDLEKSETKRKEIEVETNRTRQQLTDAKQKCSKLQDEIASLRKAKKELSAKLNSVKIYECTELERTKIDSMKTQLEQLCQHIQESEKKYNETISIYRGHLLMAAKGELNPDVLVPLKEILKLREEPHSSNNL